MHYIKETQKIVERHPVKIMPIKSLCKERLTPRRLITNPFILIHSTVFVVLIEVFIGWSRAHSPGRLYLTSPGVHLLEKLNFQMDEKDIHWRNRSKKYKFEHPRQQLAWEKGIPRVSI